MTPPPDFPVDEYRALRDGCGCVALTDWTTITFTGKDRQAFFNNFCTNDIKKLDSGDICEAFITSVKGKVLGHGLVQCLKDELSFLTVPGQAEKLIAHLERYIIREDVQLHDSTNARRFLLLTGKHAFSPRGGEAFTYWSPLSTDVRVLMETRVEDFQRVLDERIELGTKLGGKSTFESLRIEAGTPLYGVDFDDDNLPQEVGRNEQAISFTKGCYLGQETVARIDALGHVNQQLVGVRFDGEEIPTVDTELTSGGAVAGRVTSATYSPLLGAPLAIAMVRHKFLPTGTRLDSAAGPCEVVDLPIRAAPV